MSTHKSEGFDLKLDQQATEQVTDNASDVPATEDSDVPL